MKNKLREHWKTVRQTIPSTRRANAEEELFNQIAGLQGNILSFDSFKDEISTTKINKYLAEQNRLYLPRVQGQSLQIFAVQSPDEQCFPNSWGIAEPDPALCRKALLSEIAIILVPGLAFDANGHRLGYGKGYYDQLLDMAPPSTTTIGIGFKEQFSLVPLPTEPHDISLARLLLI